MNTPSKDINTQTQTIKASRSKQRNRRHWHTPEKLEIVKKYEAGELLAARGKKNFVVDPKSQQALSIEAIQGWKKQLKEFGMLNSKLEPEVPVFQERRRNFTIPVNVSQPIIKEEGTVQGLLVKALIENERLKELVQILKDNKERKSIRSSDLVSQASV